MLPPTLFLLFFAVTLLTVLGGSASLAKEVSFFTSHFYFITIYLAPFAFIKSESYLAVPPHLPRHHPFQSPILSVWGISQTDFPRLFSTFLLTFPRLPFQPHICASLGLLPGFSSWCQCFLLQKSLCVGVWQYKNLGAEELIFWLNISTINIQWINIRKSCQMLHM